MTDKILTNRQAIGVLDGLWSNPLFGETHRQAFEIGIKAIKALEQEPCEDAISRQAAIDALWKALYDYEDKTKKQFQESKELDSGDWIQHRIFVQNMNDIDRQTILELPSAQPKTGHWIYRIYGEFHEEGNWHCSGCDYIFNGGYGHAEYCPKCGCKMSEDPTEEVMRI